MKITIARECGCYGDEVGQVLADRLNVPLYNKKTLTELAKKKGILEHYPDYFGENPAGTLLAVIAEDDGEDSVVHRTPRKVLDELIGETSCILIGRAGNYAYQKENDVVRVFLSGDRESRIHHLMEKHKVKRHEAASADFASAPAADDADGLCNVRQFDGSALRDCRAAGGRNPPRGWRRCGGDRHIRPHLVSLWR